YLRGTKVKTLKATLQERKEEVMSMIKCSPACMARMKCCKPGDMEKCLKNKMHIDEKVQEELQKELKNINGNDEGKKKIIIINKKPGEVKILRNKGTGANDAEVRTREITDQQIKESISRSSDKQSLNVEYLTTSPNPN